MFAGPQRGNGERHVRVVRCAHRYRVHRIGGQQLPVVREGVLDPEALGGCPESARIYIADRGHLASRRLSVRVKVRHPDTSGSDHTDTHCLRHSSRLLSRRLAIC
jgi:hypothetical protein